MAFQFKIIIEFPNKEQQSIVFSYALARKPINIFQPFYNSLLPQNKQDNSRRSSFSSLSRRYTYFIGSNNASHLCCTLQVFQDNNRSVYCNKKNSQKALIFFWCAENFMMQLDQKFVLNLYEHHCMI